MADLLLEFEDSAVTTLPLSHLSLESMPGLIKSSSLTSCSSDCDNDSLSSGVLSPSPLYNLSSPRAIFDSYWSASSPSSKTRKKVMTNAATTAEDEDVLVRLQSSMKPLLTDDDHDSSDTITERQVEEEEVCSGSSATPGNGGRQSSSLDDTLVDYQANSPGSHSTRTSRRQILPNPPPPPCPNTAAVSPSLFIPPSSSPHILPRHILLPQCQPAPLWWFGVRPWSSTSALTKQPPQSCLRKSRYSFSGTISPSCSTDENDKHHNRSVSFYSQVSVLEFTVPQEKRSQEGWSRYFV